MPDKMGAQWRNSRGQLERFVANTRSAREPSAAMGYSLNFTADEQATG